MSALKVSARCDFFRMCLVIRLSTSFPKDIQFINHGFVDKKRNECLGGHLCYKFLYFEEITKINMIPQFF